MRFKPLIRCVGCGESLIEPGRLCLECWEGGHVKDQPDSVVTAQYLVASESQMNVPRNLGRRDGRS